jgi:hypothetical protein
MERRGSRPKAPGEAPNRNPAGYPSLHTAGTYGIGVLGENRRYLVIQPGGIEPTTAPTIIDLHGSGSWPEEHVAVSGPNSAPNAASRLRLCRAARAPLASAGAR